MAVTEYSFDKQKLKVAAVEGACRSHFHALMNESVLMMLMSNFSKIRISKVRIWSKSGYWSVSVMRGKVGGEEYHARRLTHRSDRHTDKERELGKRCTAANHCSKNETRRWRQKLMIIVWQISYPDIDLNISIVQIDIQISVNKPSLYYDSSLLKLVRYINFV